MRGHQPIIDMRLRRRKPAGWVNLTVGTERCWLAENWHGKGMDPFVAIGADEPIDRLDLRFVVGLEVVVDGDEKFADRVWRLFEACIRAGAKRVHGAVMRAKNDHGELETVEHRDSKGVIVWPA